MKPIRVALSGSGFKLPAHVGALLAVRDAGYSVIEYAGTSGGSIVAALAACGRDLDWMRSEALDRDWSDMLTWSPFSMLTNMGFCNGNRMLSWLQEATAGTTFAALGCDLTVMASDMSTMGAYEFSRSRTPDAAVALAVRASAAIPFAYSPVRRDSAWLLDGGMVNNIPADRLEVGHVPRLGVQLVSQKKVLAPGVHTIFEMIPRVISLMLKAQENTHVSLSQQIGVEIAFVETGYANSLDRNMPRATRARLMDDGYATVAAALKNMESQAPHSP